MKIKKALYQATEESSLFDYCLFNKSSEKSEKNEFLSLLFKSLSHLEWFNISTFNKLGEQAIDQGLTQVPFADKKVKEEEYTALEKTFTNEEIKEIARIIKNMKSYGVLAIKELMDDEKAINQPKK
jgi:hypothetical protein